LTPLRIAEQAGNRDVIETTLATETRERTGLAEEAAAAARLGLPAGNIPGKDDRLLEAARNSPDSFPGRIEAEVRRFAIGGTGSNERDRACASLHLTVDPLPDRRAAASLHGLPVVVACEFFSFERSDFAQLRRSPIVRLAVKAAENSAGRRILPADQPT